MGKVLIVFTSGLLGDLSDRPGRSKLEKENAAIPRAALQITLVRFSRDMHGNEGTSHLRADVFDEPASTLRNYEPGSLATLLDNFRALVPVPAGSKFASKHPESYLSLFHYPRVRMSLLAAYVEVSDQPMLVFLRAMSEMQMRSRFDQIKARVAEFDADFQRALEAAEDAIGTPP